MKRILFLGIIISLCIVSCSKDVGLSEVEATLPTPTPIPLGPDTILYTNPTDIYLVSPIGSYFPCSPIPMPLDTLFSDSIDLDLDGIFDLNFADKHYIAGFSASDPCSNYQKEITVIGINTTIHIAQHQAIPYCVAGFYTNDPIPSGYSFYPSRLFIKGAPYMAGGGSVNYLGEYYIGIKMLKNSKTMYGWLRLENTGINGIIIKDYAINLTNGNPILAGQTL